MIVILLILFLIATGLLLFVWRKYKRLSRQLREMNLLHKENDPQECNDKLISLLRNYRHDWLNHLQVILGYVSLKKLDKISSYIMQVHEEARQHTLISKLKHKDLAVFLYMIPIEYPNIQIQLELANDLPEIDFREEGTWILQTLQSIFSLLQQQSIDQHYIYSSILSMNRLEKQIVVNIELEGNLTSYHESITQIGEQVKQQGGQFFIDLYNEQEFMMEFHFPIQARGVANVC
ncbi:Spo0B domain-containing protein [Tepidibacillus fermentans]|uniref:Sensor kinase SpoOB-type protein n=1 Tax=Tepidibacillus fermentans TaxID=1281767 RepID=A0A4R3K7B0_9BACI|nr:Spo0B domain-containing protein [Tepidibacillus fermentans]TCS78760.1 sensor kinase SpoOB-type protein [Tepidibacillus fermentans]